MRYTGEKCPYCGVEFTEQDDVVVCPDCGTPHHRVCWFAHGECAATDKHADGYTWHKSAQQEQQHEEEKNEEKTNTQSDSNLDIICPDCGENCGNGTLRCPNCGAVLIPFSNPRSAQPSPDPFGAGYNSNGSSPFRPGFNPDEDIRGLKSGDIALYCRTAGANYIRKFRKKTSWNWAAFAFMPFWFFYRKLHKAGVIFFTALITLNLLMVPAQTYSDNASRPIRDEINTMMAPYIVESEPKGIMSYIYESEVQYSEEGQKVLAEFIQNNQGRIINELLKPMLPLYGLFLLLFVLHIAAALTANKLYFKKACADIKEVRSTASDEQAVRFELFRKGGTNILWGGGSYLVNEILIYALSYFLTR